MAGNVPIFRAATGTTRADLIFMSDESFFGLERAIPNERLVPRFSAASTLPFTQIGNRGSMKFASKFHVRSGANYKIVSSGQSPWPKSSRKHLMAFPYARKKITADISKELVPVPLQIGQAMIFRHRRSTDRKSTKWNPLACRSISGWSTALRPSPFARSWVRAAMCPFAIRRSVKSSSDTKPQMFDVLR